MLAGGWLVSNTTGLGSATLGCGLGFVTTDTSPSVSGVQMVHPLDGLQQPQDPECVFQASFEISVLRRRVSFCCVTKALKPQWLTTTNIYFHTHRSISSADLDWLAWAKVGSRPGQIQGCSVYPYSGSQSEG